MSFVTQDTDHNQGAEVFGRNGYVAVTKITAYNHSNGLTFIETVTSRNQLCVSFLLKIPTKDFVNFCKKVVANNQE